MDEFIAILAASPDLLITLGVMTAGFLVIGYLIWKQAQEDKKIRQLSLRLERDSLFNPWGYKRNR